MEITPKTAVFDDLSSCFVVIRVHLRRLSDFIEDVKYLTGDGICPAVQAGVVQPVISQADYACSEDGKEKKANINTDIRVCCKLIFYCLCKIPGIVFRNAVNTSDNSCE